MHAHEPAHTLFFPFDTNRIDEFLTLSPLDSLESRQLYPRKRENPRRKFTERYLEEIFRSNRRVFQFRTRQRKMERDSDDFRDNWRAFQRSLVISGIVCVPINRQETTVVTRWTNDDRSLSLIWSRAK